MAPSLFAQEPQSPTDSAMVEYETELPEGEVLIGDQFAYSITVRWDESKVRQPIVEAPADDSGFEILDREKSRVSQLDDNRRSVTYRYTLTTFEEGKQSLPRFTIHYRPIDAEESKSIQMEPRELTVNNVPPDNPDDPDIRDIRGVMAPAGRNWTLAALMGAAVGILLAAIAFWIWRRRRKPAISDLTPPRPIEEIAMEALQELEQSDLLRKGLYRQYFGELSWIVRQYVGQRFRFAAIDMTSSEIETVMGEYRDAQWMDRLRRFNEHCDLVKFARWIPDDAMVEESLSLARELIATTTPRESAESSAPGGRSTASEVSP